MSLLQPVREPQRGSTFSRKTRLCSAYKIDEHIQDVATAVLLRILTSWSGLCFFFDADYGQNTRRYACLQYKISSIENVQVKQTPPGNLLTNMFMCGSNNGHLLLAGICGSNPHLCCEQSALDAN